MKEYIDKLKEIETLVELSIGTTMTEEKAADIYAVTNDLMYKVNKKLNISDVMRSLFVKCLDECYTEANIDGYHGNDNKEYVINEILQKYFS